MLIIVGKNEFNVPFIKFTVHDDDQNKYNLTLQFRDNGVCESYTVCGVISPTGRLFALFTFVPKKLKSYSQRVLEHASGLKGSFRAFPIFLRSLLPVPPPPLPTLFLLLFLLLLVSLFVGFYRFVGEKDFYNTSLNYYNLKVRGE